MNKLQQFNIISLTYERLKNNNFSIKMSVSDAIASEELIALADSEVLRAIRKITHHPYDAQKLREMYNERKNILKGDNSLNLRENVKLINECIADFLYIPEYVSVTTPKKSDYLKLGKSGFTLNGRKYKRLLCGAGHARTNTTFFTTEDIYDDLHKVLMAGAKIKEIVPAKFNAYYALASSATYRVTKPRVCVVPDKEIQMVKTVDWVSDNEYQDTISEVDKELTFNLWDGMGLISPIFAKTWSEDLGIDYLPSAFCVRAPFVKGMVAVFDFHRFASKIAKNKYIIDLYGNKISVYDVDIILTQSQFKLWNAYENWSAYERCVEESGMQWGVSKFAPKVDTDYIRTNYQFIQVLNLTDADIDELCAPTIDWIKGVSGGDVVDMELYLMGKTVERITADNAWSRLQDSFLKSLMLEPALLRDNYIHNRIVKSLNKRIKESYIGKLIIDGNFQTMFADPYGLCEYIFGMEVNGLLKESQHYSRYWSDKGVGEVCAMRSPLTWRSEVNLLHLQDTDEMREWYKYITSGIIYNVWGVDNMIHSGADEDGDIVCTTNNPVFLRCRYGGNPVTKEAKKAKKEAII